MKTAIKVTILILALIWMVAQTKHLKAKILGTVARTLDSIKRYHQRLQHRIRFNRVKRRVVKMQSDPDFITLMKEAGVTDTSNL